MSTYRLTIDFDFDPANSRTGTIPDPVQWFWDDIL